MRSEREILASNRGRLQVQHIQLGNYTDALSTSNSFFQKLVSKSPSYHPRIGWFWVRIRKPYMDFQGVYKNWHSRLPKTPNPNIRQFRVQVSLNILREFCIHGFFPSCFNNHRLQALFWRRYTPAHIGIRSPMIYVSCIPFVHSICLVSSGRTTWKECRDALDAVYMQLAEKEATPWGYWSGTIAAMTSQNREISLKVSL